MTSVCSNWFVFGSIKKLFAIVSLRAHVRLLSSSSSDSNQKPLSQNQLFNKIIADEYDGFMQFQNTLKIRQRFKRDPTTWPSDEQPFGLTHANFIGKTLHEIELRPERAFANYVPMRPFALRHLGRMLRARLFYRTFSKYDILDQRAIIQGARKAFEVISQSIYKNELQGLIDRNICNAKKIRRFEEVMHEMSDRQKRLLDLSQNDIISIAPGVLGPFQNIRQVLLENVVHLTYSILCCAFYRKEILFDAVDKLPILEPAQLKEDTFLPIPSNYGYAAPRLVFAYMDFSHVLDMNNRKVDPIVNLFDFQFLVM
ncbi:unnamed protein product [Anisakis simplex]|uniref:Uncharacterized protein n=1 Tax=Anisakis simplex TaxID=6269 RepID=A0A0M3JTH8_ANISI|nr:unnamed protein product [Anisakis simplex]